MAPSQSSGFPSPAAGMEVGLTLWGFEATAVAAAAGLLERRLWITGSVFCDGENFAPPSRSPLKLEGER